MSSRASAIATARNADALSALFAGAKTGSSIRRLIDCTALVGRCARVDEMAGIELLLIGDGSIGNDGSIYPGWVSATIPTKFPHKSSRYGNVKCSVSGEP